MLAKLTVAASVGYAAFRRFLNPTTRKQVSFVKTTGCPYKGTVCNVCTRII